MSGTDPVLFFFPPIFLGRILVVGRLLSGPSRRFFLVKVHFILSTKAMRRNLPFFFQLPPSLIGLLVR